MCFDGTRIHGSALYSGRCYSIVAFLHDSKEQLSSHDHRCLSALAFPLPSTQVAPALPRRPFMLTSLGPIPCLGCFTVRPDRPLPRGLRCRGGRRFAVVRNGSWQSSVPRDFTCLEPRRAVVHVPQHRLSSGISPGGEAALRRQTTRQGESRAAFLPSVEILCRLLCGHDRIRHVGPGAASQLIHVEASGYSHVPCVSPASLVHVFRLCVPASDG